MIKVYSRESRDPLDINRLTLFRHGRTTQFMYNGSPVDIMISIKNIKIKYNAPKKLAIIVNDPQLNKLNNLLISFGTTPFIKKETLIMGKKEYSKKYDYDTSKKNIIVNLSRALYHPKYGNNLKFELYDAE